MPPSKVKIPSPIDTITSGVNAFDDLASTIANPPADRPLRQAIGRSGRLYCDAVGSAPGQFLAPWTGSGLVAPLLCKPYWDSQRYTPPVKVNPWEGGQCAGGIYQLAGSMTYQPVQCSSGNDQGSPTTISLQSVWNLLLDGPVTDIRWNPEGGACRELPRGLSMTVVDLGGSRSRTAQVTANQTTFGWRVTSFAPTLSRTNGADDCGDPPDLGYEPGLRPPPLPVFPPGQEPGFEPDGQPFFFVPPIPNPVPAEDPVEVPPPETGPPGGGGDGDSPPGGPAGTDGGTGDGGDEPFGDPPPGERWVGCCVVITTEPLGLGVIPSSQPESIYPEILGNVRLAFDGGGGAGYDTPIQIRQKTTCVWEPVRGMAPTGCRVNVKPGTVYSIRKYSVPEED